MRNVLKGEGGSDEFGLFSVWYFTFLAADEALEKVTLMQREDLYDLPQWSVTTVKPSNIDRPGEILEIFCYHWKIFPTQTDKFILSHFSRHFILRREKIFLRSCSNYERLNARKNPLVRETNWVRSLLLSISYHIISLLFYHSIVIMIFLLLLWYFIIIEYHSMMLWGW